MAVITSIVTTPVLAPLAWPLKTASGHIERFPLVLIDLHTDAGVTGHVYGQVYLPELLPALNSAIVGLGQLVTGQALAPRDLYTALLKRLRLWGAKNLVGAALGALDRRGGILMHAHVTNRSTAHWVARRVHTGVYERRYGRCSERGRSGAGRSARGLPGT